VAQAISTTTCDESFLLWCITTAVFAPTTQSAERGGEEGRKLEWC